MNRTTPFGFPSGRGLRLLLPSVVLALAFPAWASLGENVTSVQSDKVHMQGSVRSVATQRYVKHEIRVPTGQVVREYVSADGNVFGVAWDGPFLPDLQQVLGTYFEPMKQAAAAQQRRGRGPLTIETSGFVFHQGGHMRNFRGSAYVPALVPQGVDVTEIQ
jgi:Protein of unknown function (DUF2844)